MLRVAPGHYRDTFRRVCYDVLRDKHGWTFCVHRTGLNIGVSMHFETKNECARYARLSIGSALDALNLNA